MNYKTSVTPTYAEMVRECERWGIHRTKAFEYARLGLIETFTIGRKRYVVISSLATLPTRIGDVCGSAK